MPSVLLVPVIFVLFSIFILKLGCRSLRTSNLCNRATPPILPYLVPFFGHAFKYVTDSNALFDDAKKFSPDSRPVALTLLGKRVYVVISQDDTTAVCRNKSLAYGPLMDWALPRIFGIKKEVLNILKQDIDGPHTSVFEYSHRIVRDALREGPYLDEFFKSFLDYFSNELKEFDAKLDSKRNLRVSLFDWTYNLVGTSSSSAMMGPRFLKYNWELLNCNRRFEDDFGSFILGIPRFFNKRAWNNRNRLHQAFSWRYNNHQSNRACWWIEKSESLSADVGLSPHDIGAGTFGFWHALESNPNTVVFWMLSQILDIPGLLDHLREETAPAFDPTHNLIEVTCLLNGCPLLKSLYHETLRYTSSVTSVRVVLEDTIISGYKFVKGATVMCPARLQHFDPQVWGPDADHFVPDRFIREDKMKCIRGKVKNLRPFGSGPICPGRFFAARQILSSVGTIIQKYNIHPVGHISLLHLKAPSVGIIKPVGDMQAFISKRK